jgi:hypothetical protein
MYGVMYDGTFSCAATCVLSTVVGTGGVGEDAGAFPGDGGGSGGIPKSSKMESSGMKASRI